MTRPRAILVLTLLAVGCGGGASSPDLGTEPSAGLPDVLLVTLDTTRADRVDLDPSDGTHTPTMAALAGEGIAFTRAYTSVPVTLPAHVSLLTGRLPLRHGVRNNSRYLMADDEVSLAEVLGAAGWHTGAVIAATPLVSTFGTSQGFERFDEEHLVVPAGAGEASAVIPERSATQVTDAALALAAELAPPRFVWVHYYDPHAPLRAPEPFASAQADPYDAEIAYTDHELGRLLAGLPASPDGRLVVVAGDHGEGLGEHGEHSHGLFLHDATTRVPLVLHGFEGTEDGGRVDATVRLEDVSPTVLAELGLALPVGLDGEGLAPLWQGEAGDRPIYGESVAPAEGLGLSPIFALLDGDLRLVRTTRDRLFDLSADPGEVQDVAAERPADVARLGRQLDEQLSGRVGGDGAQLVVDAGTAQRLEALGYITVAAPEDGQGGDLYENLELVHTIHALFFGGAPTAEDTSAVVSALRGAPGALVMWERGLTMLDHVGAPQYPELLTKGAESFPGSGLIQARHAAVLVDVDPVAAGQRLDGLLELAFDGQPHHHDTYFYGADAALRLGREADATRLVAEVADAPISAAAPLFNRAWLQQRLGQHRRAVEDYRALLTVTPEDSLAWANLGIALSYDRQFESAHAAFVTSLELEPGQVDLWLKRAQLEQMMGHDSAADSCARYHGLGGENPSCASAP